MGDKDLQDSRPSSGLLAPANAVVGGGPAHDDAMKLRAEQVGAIMLHRLSGLGLGRESRGSRAWQVCP